jgi:putative metal-binding protein
MRAGLLAAAFVLAAASPAVAAPAPVPCDNLGNGHYECSWYRPGDGLTGGSLVAVGTTTVGYLHQGRNWVICQQVGGDMRTPEGDRNNWFGYTQADNGKMGWASPLDAVGGDDYGAFGGGTPNCNGKYGSPPAYSGVWGQPPRPPGATPAPGAPAVDADKDGFAPDGGDCDDFNSRVSPSAPEVANDGIDQDCNGADAAGRLSAVVAFAWTKRGSSTRVDSLRVSDAPAGASASVECSGKRKGCPKDRAFTTSAKGSVSMTKMFRKRLRPGAVVTVTVTAPNTVGRVKKFTIRRAGKPRTQTLCLVPGSKAARC